MNIAIILAGGTGECFGRSMPRQYIPVGGEMVITHCLRIFAAHPKINAIYIIAKKEWREQIYNEMNDEILIKFRGFGSPGATRQRSVVQALNDMAGYARKNDIIVIHDAVRPVVSPAQISACLKACKEHDGAVPVLPVPDTVYVGENGTISSVSEHDKSFMGQTPEAYVLGKYYKANAKLLPKRIDEIKRSPEPAVLAGLDLAMVEGDEDNFEITTRIDLERYIQMRRRE